MLIHKAKQKSVLWSAGVVNEPIVNKGGRARAAWLKLAGSVKINNPIQHLFSIEAKSGLDRTEELTKQQKLREEKSRSEMSIPPVSNPFFLDQPVADEVVAQSSRANQGNRRRDVNPVDGLPPRRMLNLPRSFRPEEGATYGSRSVSDNQVSPSLFLS